MVLETSQNSRNNNNNNRRKRSRDDDLITMLKNKRRRRLNNDDDMSEFIVDDDEEQDMEVDCPNPLCDHTEDKLYKQPTNVNFEDIHDLIKVGKSYHCKNNQTLNGVDLETLCRLVGPLTKLKNLVGMKQVKNSIVNQIVFFLQGFNKKESCGACVKCNYGLKCEQAENPDMLHTVISGPPGVGKTELGKILGEVYKEMGILSNGTFHVATRKDLVGKYLGHTAIQTQKFIDKCKGGVMFIDEAYALGSKDNRDSFAKECIDTLNQNLSESRDFLCIIAGYKDALNKCFFSQNEGLNRRFPFRYTIEGYTSDELTEIFKIKVKQEEWAISFTVKEEDKVQMVKKKTKKENELQKFFKDNRKFFPHFGGDIETLILNCKICHGRRVLFKNPKLRKILTLEDIKAGFEMYVKNRGINVAVEDEPPFGMYI